MPMQAKKRVAVLISGNGSNLQALIDACDRPEFPAQIALVISNKTDAYGLTRAINSGIETKIIGNKDYADRAAFDAALHAALVESHIEIVCLAGFMRLLTPDFVAHWEGRMINIHPSLLPAFPGLDTHAKAIASGAQFAGCSVHYVTAEMDAGPIILQAALPILPDDTPAELARRVLAEEHRIYPQALQWLAEGRLTIKNGRVIVAGADYNQARAVQHPA